MSTTKKLTLKQRSANVPLGWPPAHLLAQPGNFQRKVIFDLHGPILDWATPFIRFYCRLNGIPFDEKLVMQAIRYYDMGFDPNNPVSGGNFAAAFRDFARLAKGGYGDLPLRDPAILEVFKKLREAGIDFEIWTWVPGATEHDHDTLKANGTGIAQLVTRDRLVELGIVTDPLRQVRFISPGAKAGALTEEHLPLIVEDNPTTAVEVGYTKAHACLLVPELYNEHLAAPGILRLEKHSELAPAIIGFFAELEKAGALLGGAR